MTATDTAIPIPWQHQAAVAAGARCDTCSLKNSGRGPVPPSLPARLDLLVVAEAPGATEVAEGKTLWGASGREIRQALQSANAQMAYVGFTNACLCQPPTEMKKYLQQCKKQGLVSPIDACRPRLDQELARASFVILMGGASLQAAGVKSSSVMKLRGTPLQTGAGRPGLAIPHAAFVMRDEGRTFRSLFHADVKKAVRIAYSGSTWRDPWYFVPRTSAEVENFLANRQRSAVDVETDGIDAWTCGLRRVGIGDDKEVMIYAPLSVRGHALLPPEEIAAQTRAMAAYFQRAPRINTHNGIAFDSILLWRYGMPLRDDTNFDHLIAHQVGPTSELPHALDFLGSMYTDAPHWKDSFKHSTVRDDDALDRYLSYDIGVTYACEPYLAENLRWSQQEHIYTLDHELFKIGRSMSMLGLYVDEQKRWEFAAEYQVKATKLLAEFTAIAGREVNPNSPQQIRQLLYKDLGLPYLEEHTTDSGDPSTDESTLLDLLGLGVDERARKIIHAILGCREAEKILGTYTGHIVNGELEGGPVMHTDGCLRPVWRPGKRSGRWGSNDPNTQNWPKKLRAMIVPKQGNVLVAADMSAVELRKIALLSGDEPLMKAFAEFDAGTGPDVHIFNACTVFREKPENITDAIRDFIKRFVYALSYDAQAPKIYQTLSLLRDDNLNPKFPHITLAEVEKLYNLWWQLHPAIPAWKKKLVQGWRSRGYIETAYHKRKRFFIGGEKLEEMGNHPVQGSCADMQNDSIKGLVAAYPFDFANHRGLLVNGHDQLVVECGAHEAEDVKRIVEHVMQKKLGGMLFPAKAKAGKNWKEV